MAKEVIELTYGELLCLLSAELSANPDMEHEKAVILIGNDSIHRSSYVKGIETIHGEKIIKGSYYNKKPV